MTKTSAPATPSKVRVALIRHKQETPSRTVNLRLAVPNRLAGRSVQLEVVGGASIQDEVDISGATSFNDVLARMRRVERNNDLIAASRRPATAARRCSPRPRGSSATSWAYAALCPSPSHAEI